MKKLDTLDDIKKPGAKNDTGKLRYDLLDDIAEEALVAVLTFGANKYTPNGWRKVESAFDRYFAALRRHARDIRKYLRTGKPSDRIDAETLFPSSAQLLCNAMFICALDIAAHEGESFDGKEAARIALERWNAIKQGKNPLLIGNLTDVRFFVETGTRPLRVGSMLAPKSRKQRHPKRAKKKSKKSLAHQSAMR